MRIFYLFLCFICLCDLLHAQTVRIAYEGDPLTDKSNFMHNSDFPIRLIFN